MKEKVNEVITEGIGKPICSTGKFFIVTFLYRYKLKSYNRFNKTETANSL